MNLTPLYRITDPKVKKAISALIDKHGEGLCIDTVQSWCTEKNWTDKFCKKYKHNFETRPQQLVNLLQGSHTFEPVLDLIRAAKSFSDPRRMFQELERRVFSMLKTKTGIVPALQVLFYLPSEGNQKKDETGKLSVVLDTIELQENGFSTVGPKFAQSLNQALTEVEKIATRLQSEKKEKDAFGLTYEPIDEPMPKIKLAAGFDVTLRTMFKGQPCQFRYGMIEGGSYPLSREKRTELSAALDWLSQGERENKTWVRTGVNEVMFIYPSKIPKKERSFTCCFQQPDFFQNEEATFVAMAKDFSKYLIETKEYDPDRYPEWIQFFALKKLDKARTKVVYTRNETPEEIVSRSALWQKAAQNIPEFHFVNHQLIPFPLRCADVLNKVWKRDGTQVTDKYRESSSFHGIDLFFGISELELKKDLRTLVQNSEPLALCVGTQLIRSRSLNHLLPRLQSVLVLMGMLLYWMNYRKDDYMNGYPYLFGQLLKAADSLHELYCYKERKGDYPPQLVGSAMYLFVSEHPIQGFTQFTRRVAPYLNWARSPKNWDTRIPYKKENGEETFGPTAGYYLNICTQIANKLKMTITDQIRFTDAEKAQLFIGYLASFPRKDQEVITSDNKKNEN